MGEDSFLVTQSPLNSISSWEPRLQNMNLWWGSGGREGKGGVLFYVQTVTFPAWLPKADVHLIIKMHLAHLKSVPSLSTGSSPVSLRLKANSLLCTPVKFKEVFNLKSVYLIGCFFFSGKHAFRI
jgi:hypothetical protein